ncbi:MAG: Mov34/MPN/PAD-1 family protein [Planctomycetales bacterium]|nr:Mov34/MPN/PAD-1 family protein [Planctomycetales bacterium]
MADELPEIRLGNLQVRPPESRPWPLGRPGISAERRGDAREDDRPLFVAAGALQAASDWSCADTSREVGGLLLGFHGVDEGREFAELTAFLPAGAAQGGPAHVVFTHDAFAALEKARDALDPSLAVVGWHHTHPGYGVFLSDADRFLHTRFFPFPWQAALVVDPVRRELGFFREGPGGLRTTGFFILRVAGA